ncbi:MAG: transposase [Acidobacteria bacterium]|nr:transposase [Acidobacteriota bacterium]
MRNWRHSGFSVHNEVVIQKEDREALVRLAQYVAHASFSSEKIRYVEKTGCVMYKSNLHQGKKRNFEVLDAIESLHRVCLHIPGHYEALIRYYGHYANAARGKRKKLGLEDQALPVVVDDAPDRKICRKSWARLIYQVYEIDPLKCPKCGAQMKIIAFILDLSACVHAQAEREEVIRILRHLQLWPIEYPEPAAIEARASPFDFKLLRKLSD